MGFAGLEKGSFFGLPEWIDASKKPGYSSLAAEAGGVVGFLPWSQGVVTLSFFTHSPNLVWFLIAVCVYVFFPYDMDPSRTLTGTWFWARAPLNLAVVSAYYGFWSASLYQAHWAGRKFNSENIPTLARMCHNISYCVLGTLQYTLWEAAFVHLYATGRLPHIRDADAFASAGNALRMVVFSLAVPLYRDFHFYFAHRFLHCRVLYKYVHSLHHRNTDIEPFSGLCMHPVEHLYYFACLAPSLAVFASPFHMLWNGIHLLLSPAASHSGWEDHFQSDQYHYIHHSKFECNYGTSGVPMDLWFGTFRASLDPKDRHYKGAATDTDIAEAAGHHSSTAPPPAVAVSTSPDVAGEGDDTIALRLRARRTRKQNANSSTNGASDVTAAGNRIKSNDDNDTSSTPVSEGGRGHEGSNAATLYRPRQRRWAVGGVDELSLWDALPDRADQFAYNAFVALVFGWCVHAAAVSRGEAGGLAGFLGGEGAAILTPEAVGALVGFGPVVFGLGLLRLTGDKKSWRWPFHKEAMAVPLVMHLGVGMLSSSLFTYWTVRAALGGPCLPILL